MCGGRGTRLDADVEKPLLEVAGRPMIGRVLAALEGSRVGTVRAVPSPHVPATRSFLEDRGIPIVETPGAGYVEDLGRALCGVRTPALTVAADLPLLAGDAIDRVLGEHEAGSMTVAIPAALKRALGVSLGPVEERGGRKLVPSGVNVVADANPDRTLVTHDVRLAVNVNRASDARVAERLA